MHAAPFGGGLAAPFAKRRHGNCLCHRACSVSPAFAELQAVFARTGSSAEAPRGPLMLDDVTAADA
jgi:hypothetical protein